MVTGADQARATEPPAMIMDSGWAANLPAIQRTTARAGSDRLTYAEWQVILNGPETT